MDNKPLTYLEVNTSHLLHNLRYFRSLTPTGTKMLVLVKVYGYGHGVVELAKLLEAQGVDYLAVAFTHEGIDIRKAGVKLPILVLSDDRNTYPLMIQYHLEPSIPCMGALKAFCACGTSHYPVHLKIDTGMHRLGFSESELPELLAFIDHPAIKVASVYSHLVASPNPEQDALTRKQIDRFTRGSALIFDHLPYRPMRHLLNSAGIERFAQEASFDMVRLGVGLYGVSALDPKWVRHTAYLRTHVLQIKEVPQGEGVGYGLLSKAEHGPLRTATLGIGYGDGVNRRLGLGAISFSVNGQLAPTIGSICMDMCMIDVTGLDVKEGDEVTLFGDNPTIDDWARLLGTIPYEVLTWISLTRVPRIYV